MGMMKLSCEQWCHVQEMLPHPKRQNRFNAKSNSILGKKENALYSILDWQKGGISSSSCWDHLGSEKGKDTFFEIFPFDLAKGTFHG